ncbi:mechanosensitive ion channel protein 10-like [Chenopodium quinoa]|uniref:mechanosensitive ion channel protein 10-like n=1 Tax=Chenopodium quinoa TaxID=63459 RepID=UPI000B799E68|nr:mechanosensitive ion channel protein 10-like [Chenopodium quinoa]XP_021762199.1 mechanosensitive ion channel protein 10-like [Chenopodium quinoa]
MAETSKKNPEEIAIPISPLTNEQSPKKGFQNNENEAKPTNHSPQSQEISNFSPSPRKPPLYPTPESPLRRRITFKEKTRFGEPSVPLDSQTLEILGGSPRFSNQQSFSEKTPKASEASGRKEKEKQKDVGPDEREIYKRVTAQLSAKKSWRMTIKLVLEMIVFLLILGCLICSLIVDKFKGKLFCGLEVWKWFALLMAIFSGMLVTGWFVHCIVFLIEWKFLLKKNVVYFTHGLQDTVVVVIWIAVVLVTWVVLFKHDSDSAPKLTAKTKRKLDFITWTLASLLIGSVLWLVKTTLIKILASSFHLNRFFDRIQEAVFHHYVLQTLSGRPVVELASNFSRSDSRGTQVSFRAHTGNHMENKVVDWEKIHQMKREKVPSWTMKLLVDVISNSGLSTMSGIFKQDVVEGGVELDDDEITCEEEAIATAVRIFYNVIGDKTDNNDFYIDRGDLHRFMIWEEVDVVYPLFEVNEKKQIDMKAFSKWVVNVFKDRQALKHALNDNKTAVDEFNKLLNGLLIIIITVLWLLLTEVLTTKILLFFSSQLLVAVFVFGNTCKTVFEALIFVFVMHPFDVGDRCVIDGTLMIVEEMNILTTVFLKLDREKVYYPNALLSTKSIGNYYRSPDQGDTLEFAIDYRTPLPKIAELKERIKQYVEKTSHYWHPEHSMVVKEIENINKIKMAVYVTHTMNFQDIVEKSKRRTEFFLEMKSIFDDLEISYQLLPQEIHLTKAVQNI